jgi:hypothetical protein
MSSVINTTRMTVDAVTEVDEWYVAEGDHDRAPREHRLDREDREGVWRSDRALDGQRRVGTPTAADQPGRALACELQRDWAREETVADVVEIVLTERLLQP